MSKKKIDEKQLKTKFYSKTIKEFLIECKEEITIVQKNDSIDTVLSLLYKNHHVWVIENKENMKLLGVINRVDLLHLLAPPRSYYHIFSIPESYHQGTIGEAEDIMHTRFITCTPDSTIQQVLKKMIRHTTEKGAILSEDGKIQGEINLKSLIKHYHSVKLQALKKQQN